MNQIEKDFANRWLFRWGFDFHSKPTRKGLWNSPSNNPQDMASFVNKDGLVLAYVEGKNFLTKEIKVFFDMAGQDFINFETLRIHISNSSGVMARDYGMRIIGRFETLTAYETGLIERERTNTDTLRYPDWTRT